MIYDAQLLLHYQQRVGTGSGTSNSLCRPFFGRGRDTVDGISGGAAYDVMEGAITLPQLLVSGPCFRRMNCGGVTVSHRCHEGMSVYVAFTFRL